ncbi:MAG: DsbA family protein [Nitrosopumilaceae archaeon]
MSNLIFLVIPIVVGIATGFFLSVSLVNTESIETETLLTATKLIENGSPMLGESSADITILEWGDYQCTFCFRFHESSLNTIIQDYIETGRVNLVFKDFPLNGPDSVLAAEASYCAEEQGKYWQYHDELYTNWGGEHTGWITRDSLNHFAVTVKLNEGQFNSCLDEHKFRQRVLDLHQFGLEIGIDATPSFLIFNDEKVVKIRGNQPIEVFIRTIEGL